MWTPATRAQHTRVAKRYQTDLSDAEWRLIAAFLPEASSTGRRREWPMREIVNAIFYVLRGGITWRLLPKDFPPWQTVYRWFAWLRDEAVFERMNHALVMADRERTGREATPSAAIIDSQSVIPTDDQLTRRQIWRTFLAHACSIAVILSQIKRGASVRHFSDCTPDVSSQQRRFQPLLALFPVRHHLSQQFEKPCVMIAVSGVAKFVGHHVLDAGAGGTHQVDVQGHGAGA